MHRPHHRRLAASSLGLALLVGGCAAPGAPTAEPPPAAVSVTVGETTPTSVPAPTAPDAPTITSVPTSAPATTSVPAPEVWESRDTSRRTVVATGSPVPTPPAATPTPTPDPAPSPDPTPPQPPPPPPAPPELVVGDDGCVTDVTTGLVVTCYDPAAGPDEEPGTP